jgi:hypothetical protein
LAALTITAIVCALAGAVLGFFFTAAILILATLVTLFIACLIILNSGYGYGLATLLIITAVTALQAGFFGAGTVSVYCCRTRKIRCRP